MSNSRAVRFTIRLLDKEVCPPKSGRPRSLGGAGPAIGTRCLGLGVPMRSPRSGSRACRSLNRREGGYGSEARGAGLSLVQEASARARSGKSRPRERTSGSPRLGALALRRARALGYLARVRSRAGRCRARRVDPMKTWLETRDVLDRLAECRRRGARAALATVVQVRGSAYRHEGAKLLVCEDGTTAGNVSGGCLEQDVREAALRVIRTGAPARPSYSSSPHAIPAWALRVGCEGQVDLYVEPALAPRPRERALLDGRRPFAVCTVLAGPREAARAERLVVTATGTEGGLGAAGVAAPAAARAPGRLGARAAGRAQHS